jgi:hypothetical protein
MPLHPQSGTTERRLSLPATRAGAQITPIWMRPLPSAGQPPARISAGTRAPEPRRQSRYVIRMPAILAELCRIVHR